MPDLKEILAELDAAVRVTPGGDDGFTTYELADALGVCEVAAQRRIKRWYRAGLLKVGRKLLPNITGVIRPVPCYAPIKGKGKKR